jgi:aminoglycoside phosphotransferase (APT) family kinase protein
MDDRPDDHADLPPPPGTAEGLPPEVAGSALLATIGSHPVTPLGAGTDHRAFRVGDDLVLRCSIDHTADEADRIRREVALLALVGGRSPVPVPEVVACDPEAGLVLMTLLPGRALLDAERPDREALARQLGPFLEALHATPLDAAGQVVEIDETPHAEYLDGARADADALVGRVDEHLLAAVRRSLAGPPPPDPPPRAVRLCHNDLGAEHLLVSGASVLRGVIDWSDAALTDRARDYGKLVRDLGLGPIGPLMARAAADDPGLVARAVFHARCSLVEDLRYGLDTGDHRYSTAATARLAALS